VTLAAFLVGMVGPLMARWLASMGLSLVSVTGLVVAYGALKAQVISNIGGLPEKGVQLAGLMGIWEALGIVLGAFVFVMTWRGTSGFWKLAKS
jgi:hypothetical protein